MIASAVLAFMVPHAQTACKCSSVIAQMGLLALIAALIPARAEVILALTALPARMRMGPTLASVLLASMVIGANILTFKHQVIATRTHAKMEECALKAGIHLPVDV